MSKLNQKIKTIFDSFDKYDNYSWSHKQEAANSIEKLLLEEQIDLLSNLKGANSGGTELNINFKNIELTQRLKQINQ